MPRASVFPPPRFARIKEIPRDPLNATQFEMVVHTGTHVDAPRHFFSDGPSFDEIPLERLSGSGVVWRIEKDPDGTIEVADLERAKPQLRPGDILALDTGWSSHFGTNMYDRHPSLSVEAALWLVERNVKLVACDFATPDLAIHRRQPGFDWPVHHVLLSRGVLVCEHLRGHRPLAGGRAEFAFCALNIRGSDGAPARVIARPMARG